MQSIGPFLAFGATCVALADGLQTWQWRSPLPPGNTLEAIIYADGRFLAVGYNSAMMTSTNGVSWNGLNSDTNFELTSLVVGNGIFVAVGG